MNLPALIRLQKVRNAFHLNMPTPIRQFANTGDIKPDNADLPDLELEQVEVGLLDDTSVKDTIEVIRNKSRLFPRHYAKFHKKVPSLTEEEKQVFSLNYLRKIYAEHGTASGISVGLLWPSKEEMELAKERERVAYPDDISRMIEIAKQSEEEEKQRILERQEDLACKVAKLEGWKKEVRDRVENQARLAREAKKKKEKVMEEVRQMFGFRIDPKDEKFKEALEKKEQEEKKAAKAAKKLKKQQKLVADIKRMAGEDVMTKTESSSKDDSNLYGSDILPGEQTKS